ncbi:flavoprotein [Streptomyces ziwulingensis]|uniref:Uncharacterized protein n=1 Tax=Streptomyces ziwulingensis TaxID=1045501 RepID=A0ABP9B3Q3_9ACTN
MARVLYLIACAAGPTQYVDDGVRAAQADGWDVCLLLTPSAATWWEPQMQELVDLTGHPVRSRYKLPWEKDAFFNQAQGAQPAVARSILALREQGVLVLDGPDGYESHPPKQGDPKAFPWVRALTGVRRLAGLRP